ncbi:hypothetical protein ADL30_23845 [Streptomyces sp. NRRL S-1521]|nr:hypothetical protein ADL30_23845 [Streptomyces sp. NRRL S-1521]
MAYAEISQMLPRTWVNAREMVSRPAGTSRPSSARASTLAEHRRLLGAFVAVEESGDMASLESILIARGRQPVRTQRHP